MELAVCVPYMARQHDPVNLRAERPEKKKRTTYHEPIHLRTRSGGRAESQRHLDAVVRLGDGEQRKGNPVDIRNLNIQTLGWTEIRL